MQLLFWILPGHGQSFVRPAGMDYESAPCLCHHFTVVRGTAQVVKYNHTVPSMQPTLLQRSPNLRHDREGWSNGAYPSIGISPYSRPRTLEAHPNNAVLRQVDPCASKKRDEIVQERTAISEMDTTINIIPISGYRTRRTGEVQS